jgi:glycosyltransferase involved in cell wall biosynthesis
MLTVVPGGMGGSETYARELTAQLRDGEDFAFEAVLPESAAGFASGMSEAVVEGLRNGPTALDRARTAAWIAVHATSVRRRFADADLVHYPFTVPAPKPSTRQASVQSLLDVQHLELPGMFGRTDLLYRARYYEGFARRADAVITISEFAKARMVELLGLEPERIFVAHLGVDTSRYVPYLGARENFVLYPARGWPHKNHARLIEAVGRARERIPELRLVLTGGGLDGLGELPDWVDRRGLVDAAELRELYRRASALVFPSLYEGFGLPPLEAMASGCPVAVSDAGSIPEVVGTAGVRFDPTDVDAIADGMVRAIENGPALAKEGLEHVKAFTWESCRDAHLAAYRFALENRR